MLAHLVVSSTLRTMSALLSPPKSVRSRFRVPGEGSYELFVDVLHPHTRVSMQTSTSFSASPQGASKNPSAQSSSQASSGTFSSSTTAGPLGLPSATKVAVARKAQLVCPSHSLLQVTSSSSTASSKESSQQSVMSSIRKLPGLGTFAGFGGKFAGTSSLVSSEETSSSSAHPAAIANLSQSPPAASAVPYCSPQSPTAKRSLNANANSVNSNSLYPQSPPSALTSRSFPAATASTLKLRSPVASSNGNNAIPAARHPDTNGPHQQVGEAPTPSGVLAYNSGDAVIVLDLATHASFSTSSASDTSITLRLKCQPTAHALASYGDKLRLVVGCINGEIAFWEDIGIAHARESANVPSRKARIASSTGNNNAAASGAAMGPLSQPSSSLSSSQTTFNKDGNLNSSRVVAIRWLPGPGFRFVAVHLDGALIIYDTRLKKAAATATAQSPAAQENQASATPSGGLNPTDSVANRSEGGLNGSSHTNGLLSALSGPGTEGSSQATSCVRDNTRMENSHNPGGASLSATEREKIVASVDKGANSAGSACRRANSLPLSGPIGQHDIAVLKPSKGKRINPVMIWQVGCGAIADAEFAPCSGASGEPLLLAIASRDGYLRVLDISRESMVVAFRSYFGALLCTSWSPDGKYLAAGGEDDLVSIWCPSEECLVARCEGHTSWVSAVSWDATLCGGGRYRLGSAGQDAKLLLWDFSMDMLVTRMPSVQRGPVKEDVLLNNISRDAVDGLNLSVLRTSSVSSSNGTLNDSRHPCNPAHGGSSSPSPSPSAGSTASQDTHLKSAASSSVPGVGPVSSSPSGFERKPGKFARLRSHATGGMGSKDELEFSQLSNSTTVIVGAPGRAAVPSIEPVLTHLAHTEPLTDISFVDTGIVTADCIGNVKLWMRPPQVHIPPLVLDRTNGHNSVSDPVENAAPDNSLQRSTDLD